jgi:hypothetical protein
VAAEKTVSIKIKAAPTPDTKKSLDQLQKISTNWDAVFGKNGDKLVRNQKRYVNDLTRSWQDLGKAIKLAKDNFKGGFETGSKSLAGVKAFTSGIEGATKKVLNLKNAIAATAIGGAAIWGVKRILSEGSEDIKTRKRIGREFGAGKGSYGDYLTDLGDRVGLKGGMQGDEAARGLIPLAEQLEAIQEGAQFRGMKRKLTGSEAEALKRKNLTFGGGLLQRLGALVPDMEPEELGRVLGDALAGPEGVRSLVSNLHLSKRSRKLSEANEKGEAFKLLTPEERKRMGVTRQGQFLEQGDLVNLLLERSGLTDKAATDERKTFGFQMKSIKAQLGDTLGDIGSGALDTLTEKLGKGATAAERLQSYLTSEDGKKTINAVKDGVVGIVDGIASIASKLPEIGSWLKEHKGLLGAIAGVYGVAKVAPTIAGIAKGASAVLGGARGATPVTPLYVYNVNGGSGGLGSPGGGGPLGLLKRVGLGIGGIAAAGGVGAGLLLSAAGAAAGYVGYKGGNALGKKSTTVGKLHDAEANWLYRLTGEADADKRLSDFGTNRNQTQLNAIKAKREALTKALEAQGISHGSAVQYAEHPEQAKSNPIIAGLIAKAAGGDVNVTTNLVLDGVTLAKLVEKHMVRNVQNRTANGAAPVSKQ